MLGDLLPTPLIPHPRKISEGRGFGPCYLARLLFCPLRRQETSLNKMGLYCVRVSTGSSFYAGSNNKVQLWLVGQHGEAALGTRLRPVRGKVSWREPGGGLRPWPQGRQILEKRRAPCAKSARRLLGRALRAVCGTLQGLNKCSRRPPPWNREDTPARLSFTVLSSRNSGTLERLGVSSFLCS